MYENRSNNNSTSYSKQGSGFPPKHRATMHSDPSLSALPTNEDVEYYYYANRNSSFSATSAALYDDTAGRLSTEGSPMMMSPWNHQVSPFRKSPWLQHDHVNDDSSTTISQQHHHHHHQPPPPTALLGSLVREEGHIYSLATRPGDLLYTGSDSKNIRVWKNLKEYSGFKSTSGLVKAIVISKDQKIFTGHQDGKIRVWKVSPKNATVHKRSGSLPTLKDIFKYSIKPSSYVEVKKRHRSTLWIKHSDAISCLSLCECDDDDSNLLYSASWDRTFKVWRVGDSKCLESVIAHDDAVNSVIAGVHGLVFSGSADGTVKVWKREVHGKVTKHVFLQTLIKQECAVTALAVDPSGSIIYCGLSDGLVNFWEREKDLAHGGVLRGHKLAVLCMVAKGRLVFSGAADKNICVWRREGTIHTCLSVLSGHTGPVKCLAVEEDLNNGGEKEGRWVVYSGSLDKSIKVWSINDADHHHHLWLATS